MTLWTLALLLLSQETAIPAPTPVATVPSSSDAPPTGSVFSLGRFHALADASLGYGGSQVILGGEAQSGKVVTAGLTGALEHDSRRIGLRLRFLTANLTTDSIYSHASTKMYSGSICGMGQMSGLWAEGCFGIRRHEWKNDHESGKENTPDMVVGGGYDLYLFPAVALRGSIEISTAVLEWMAHVSVGLVMRI